MLANPYPHNQWNLAKRNETHSTSFPETKESSEKVVFECYFWCLSPSKVFLFLTFYKGDILYNFLFFISTRLPGHPSKSSLTHLGRVHCPPHTKARSYNQVAKFSRYLKITHIKRTFSIRVSKKEASSATSCVSF